MNCMSLVVRHKEDAIIIFFALGNIQLKIIFLIYIIKI